MTPKEKRTLTDITKFLLKECLERESDVHVLTEIISGLSCGAGTVRRDAAHAALQKKLKSARKRHLEDNKERFLSLQALIRDA
jgi:hypothetical protein